MKRRILYITLLFFGIISGVYSQETLKNKCNRRVRIKSFKSKLPREVCLPNGNYHVFGIFDRKDLNEDGLDDFIFSWCRDSLIDGDTIFVSIYTQNTDSTYTLFHTFNNLFPLFFKRYDLDYIPKDEKLRKIHSKYDNEYLLLSIEFETGRIKITRKLDASARLIISYKYDKILKNCIYEKCEEYIIEIDKAFPYDLSSKLGPTIDNFTYFIWDE